MEVQAMSLLRMLVVRVNIFVLRLCIELLNLKGNNHGFHRNYVHLPV
jgi:hypothetical protein